MILNHSLSHPLSLSKLSKMSSKPSKSSNSKKNYWKTNVKKFVGKSNAKNVMEIPDVHVTPVVPSIVSDKPSYKNVLLNEVQKVLNNDLPEYNLETGTLDLKSESVVSSTVDTSPEVIDDVSSPFKRGGVTISNHEKTKDLLIECDMTVFPKENKLTDVVFVPMFAKQHIKELAQSIVENVFDECYFIKYVDNAYDTDELKQKKKAANVEMKSNVIQFIKQLLSNYSLDINYSAFSENEHIGGGNKTGRCNMTLFVHKATGVLFDPTDWILLKHNNTSDGTVPLFPVTMTNCSVQNNFLFLPKDHRAFNGKYLCTPNLKHEGLCINHNRIIVTTKSRDFTFEKDSLTEIEAIMTCLEKSVGKVGKFTNEAVLAILSVLELTKFMLLDLIEENTRNKEIIMLNFKYNETQYDNMCGYVLTKYRYVCFQLELHKILYHCNLSIINYNDGTIPVYSYPSIILSQPTCGFKIPEDPLCITSIHKMNVIYYCSYYYLQSPYQKYITDIYDMNSDIYTKKQVELKCNVSTKMSDGSLNQENTQTFMFSLRTIDKLKLKVTKIYYACIKVYFTSQCYKSKSLKQFTHTITVSEFMDEFNEDNFREHAETIKQRYASKAGNINVSYNIYPKVIKVENMGKDDSNKNNCFHSILNFEFPTKPILPNLVNVAMFKLCASQSIDYDTKEYNIQLIRSLVKTYYVHTLRAMHNDAVHNTSKIIDTLLTNKLIQNNEVNKTRTLLDIGLTAMFDSELVTQHIKDCERVHNMYLKMFDDYFQLKDYDLKNELTSLMQPQPQLQPQLQLQPVNTENMIVNDCK